MKFFKRLKTPKFVNAIIAIIFFTGLAAVTWNFLSNYKEEEKWNRYFIKKKDAVNIEREIIESSQKIKDSFIPTERQSSPKALDLGSGTGPVALWLAHEGWNVTATDKYYKNALQRIEQRAKAQHLNIKTEILDLTKDDFPHEQYDLITARNVLPFLSKKNIEAVVSEKIIPSLKKDNAYSCFSGQFFVPGHDWCNKTTCLTPEEVKKLFLKCKNYTAIEHQYATKTFTGNGYTNWHDITVTACACHP